MDAVAVAHRLGHSSPEVTYRFYAHAINSRDAASAAAMQHYLDAATAPNTSPASDEVTAPDAQPASAAQSSTAASGISADSAADAGAKK